jgi:hypothetical protein
MTLRYLSVTVDQMIRATVVYAVGLIFIIGGLAFMLWLSA